MSVDLTDKRVRRRFQSVDETAPARRLGPERGAANSPAHPHHPGPIRSDLPPLPLALGSPGASAFIDISIDGASASPKTGRGGGILRVNRATWLALLGLLLLIAHTFRSSAGQGEGGLAFGAATSSRAGLWGKGSARETFVYAHAGPLQAIHAFNFLFAREVHPNARMVLVRHESMPTADELAAGVTTSGVTDEQGIDWDSLAKTIGLETVWADQSTETELHERFAKAYVHQSSNAIAYERFCFVRFFSVLATMKRLGVYDAFVLDMDIIPFQNFFKAFPVSPWAMLEFSTYLARWTLPALQAFCEFMVGFYERPVPEMVRDFVDFGYVYAPSPPNMTDAVAAAWPVDMPPKQFSDMTLFGAFISKHPHLIPRSTHTGAELTMLSRQDVPVLNGRHIAAAQGTPEYCADAHAFASVYEWAPVRRSDNEHESILPQLQQQQRRGATQVLARNATMPWTSNGSERSRIWRSALRLARSPSGTAPDDTLITGLHLQGIVCKALTCDIFCPAVSEKQREMFACCGDDVDESQA